MPQTPWGDPDLQGVWSGAALLTVPFDRDAEFGTRNELTEAELQARLALLLKSASSGNIEATDFGVGPELPRFPSRQASLVIDPPNGRRPPRTPAAETRRPKRNSFVPGVFDSVADLGLFDRCIAYNTVPGAFPFNGIEQVTIIERYTLIDRDHLSYEATIDDPGTWTRPWTVAFPRTRDESHGLYEYACHEGNYSLANILRASRAADASTSK